MEPLIFPLRSAFNTAFPLINAVVANVQEGLGFRDEINHDLLFIIHKSAFSYVTNTDSDRYAFALDFMLNRPGMPGYFHVYDPPLSFLNCCANSGDEINSKIRKRIQLQFTATSIIQELSALPKGYMVKQIDDYNFEALGGFNLSIESKFWKSKKDFLQNGFGFCVFNELGAPVSICYAAGLANGAAEIDVATLPDYQKRGFANIVVAAFVKYCKQHSVVANWDCFDDNLGSLKTAERIGFRQTMSYTFLSIFNKKNHETN